MGRIWGRRGGNLFFLFLVRRLRAAAAATRRRGVSMVCRLFCCSCCWQGHRRKSVKSASSAPLSDHERGLHFLEHASSISAKVSRYVEKNSTRAILAFVTQERQEKHTNLHPLQPTESLSLSCSRCVALHPNPSHVAVAHPSSARCLANRRPSRPRRRPRGIASTRVQVFTLTPRTARVVCRPLRLARTT